MAGTPATTPRGQGDPARDEKARRVRNLLSSYYGAADAGGAPEAAPEQPGTPSRAAARAPLAPRAAAGLDSTTFDADRYLAQLLRSTRLDALLAKHAEVSTEIRSLDSDMQMLVYENYNKFISATDTIRSMKSNVDGMDSNMQELQRIIGALARGAPVQPDPQPLSDTCLTSRTRRSERVGAQQRRQRQAAAAPGPDRGAQPGARGRTVQGLLDGVACAPLAGTLAPVSHHPPAPGVPPACLQVVSCTHRVRATCPVCAHRASWCQAERPIQPPRCRPSHCRRPAGPHAAAPPQVRELLAKLQAVFDLPRRLHTAIARGALELAVGYYADAAPLLRRYGHKARPPWA